MFGKNIKKEKELINKELELYRRENLLKISEEIEAQRQERIKEVQDLAVRCADDTKKLEHQYHYNQETLGIEIAKLEAKKEYLQEVMATDKVAFERIIKDKDEEINRLNAIILEMVKSKPEVAIHNHK